MQGNNGADDGLDEDAPRQRDANKKKNDELVYKKIDAWAKKFVKRLQPFNIPGHPTNVTRAKAQVVTLILCKRTKKNRCELYDELTTGLDGDEIYIIRNEKEYAGYDSIATGIVAIFGQLANKTDNKRVHYASGMSHAAPKVLRRDSRHSQREEGSKQVGSK